MNKVAVFISKYKFGLVALLFFVLAVAFLCSGLGSVRYGFSLSDKLEEIEKGQLMAISYTTVSSEDDIVGASAYAFKCFVIVLRFLVPLFYSVVFINAKKLPPI